MIIVVIIELLSENNRGIHDVMGNLIIPCPILLNGGFSCSCYSQENKYAEIMFL